MKSSNDLLIQAAQQGARELSKANEDHPDYTMGVIPYMHTI